MGLGRHKASLLHNGGQTETTCRVSESPERSFGSPNVAPSVRQQGVIEPVRYACRPRQFAGLTEEILGVSTRPMPGRDELRWKETERGNGRDDRIRTCDVLVPNQVLYQAELRPERRDPADNASIRKGFLHQP